MMNQSYSNGYDDEGIRKALLAHIHEVEEQMIAHMFTYNRILDLHNDEAFRAFRERRDGDVLTILGRMEQMLHDINKALPEELFVPPEPETLSNEGVRDDILAVFTEAWEHSQN